MVACGPKDDPVIAVTGITLSQTSISLEVGGKVSLTATVSPSDATDKTVTWTSSDPSVVSVESGLVKAVSAGTATVTATAGGKSAKCEVNVQPRVVDVTGISLNKTDLTLNPGGTFQLEATVSPSDATDKTVTWTSSDPSVVSVENGLVKAVSAGTATVTATAGGKSARCEVTVQIPSSNEGYGYEDLK